MMNSMNSVLIRKQLVPPSIWLTARVAKCFEEMPERIGPQRLTMLKAFCIRFPKYDNMEGITAVRNMLDKRYVPLDKEDMVQDLEVFTDEVKSGEINEAA